MNKRAYIQENKDWLEAKAKKEGVKALPKEPTEAPPPTPPHTAYKKCKVK